ncbi:MAG: hypothetical protein AAF990_17835 [Bacteroidota bacterium]
MNSINFFSTILLLLLLASSCNQKVNDGNKAVQATPTNVPNLSKYEIPGATVLAFGPDNVLFIGDSKGGIIHAVTTTATPLNDPVPYNLEGFDEMLAKKLGKNQRDFLINDMKVHPVSQEAYLAVKNGHHPDAKSMIAVVSPTSPEIRLLEINEANSTKVTITNPASADLKFWNETPASSLTITDMDYNNGYLYVAGLSNGDFASNLRKIAYPFDGNQESVKSIEIYHAVHTQMETRAPIRTMLFDDLDGTSTLLASYTCTPLVSIPSSAIEKDKEVKGKTIAELGYGNTPIDMLMVMSQGFDGSMSKSLLITHKNRGGSLIPYDSVVKGVKGKGMEGARAMFASGLEEIVEVPTANVMHIDKQNQMMLTMLRRNMETGAVDLVSEMTGTYLRLSDFISEYDFPSYQYPEQQAMTKQYHDMVKKMEGYPDLTSDKMERN